MSLLKLRKKVLKKKIKLEKDRDKALTKVEERLARAYTRIRESMVNGVAVAPIVRGACGGCFSNIPPQRKSDVRAHFQIIDCESCGRILVDKTITGLEEEE